MQRGEYPALPADGAGTDAGEANRWKDPLFGSKMSLVWYVVVMGTSIVLLTLIGRQQREKAH